ncbi:DUF1326 domain-containing protein [Rhizobium bangladeshense]|uniref:DUF1326 domain-containing protein n=1 Tax=Rhizobium bangladeshense TaxID=1138189 RepID=A0ABS7LPS8_9HYPH|nr:DUF1326 domain-containing protein [Rhizobium bangladeshense]MBX4869284.1 DUF1326 domain-containing protein [Rhizobium bangladeshense]MBX4874681.1 DUF1326 domain-containing protein [Rhizobium bangladeshense]MBX4885277.1 DUF1326 domain-containing protein [Rhizobium bangladeshense]MBY3592688.1 DUF1326 domain-containing protein [Rhizobium bangladeshense]
MTPWEIDALAITNCNCSSGCPCQFNSLPTNGNCEAAVGFAVKSGFYGDVRLDGVKMAFTAKWPGPIHLGNGTIQLIVDPSATPAQRDAVATIVSGGDTEDMATMFWVFSKMSPNKLDVLTKPIDLEVDVEKRTGHVRVLDVFEMDIQPIRNPVTGAEHRARINLPHGFEYRVAEIASGTTKTFGMMSLENNKDSHAHICRVYMNGQGVIEHAA